MRRGEKQTERKQNYVRPGLTDEPARSDHEGNLLLGWPRDLRQPRTYTVVLITEKARKKQNRNLKLILKKK